MGNKKRGFAPRSKPFQSSGSGTGPSPLPVVTDDSGVSSVETNESPNFGENKDLKVSKIKASKVVEPGAVAIKLECERALTALGRGNHTKALRIMKDLCGKNENSVHLALVHRVQATVCVKVAALIDDPNGKQKHFRNAIESARKAVFLSPNSIEFRHFHANLMYEAANDGNEYEEVVQECERALAIENPVDPATESLQAEAQLKVSTVDARIEHVHEELRSLIQKANISSISTWMKNLGNGEEKFRFIPLRKAPEDPMELRSIQARKANEIKKATKTPEERRKEIEVRVAAARLLQQKSETPETPESQNDGDKVLDALPRSGQRVGERRKSARRNASCAERKDSVRAYWNSMKLELKKDLLKISISDIKAHYSSYKDAQTYDVLSEALSCFEATNGWKFWACCRCSVKFSDAESHMQHVMQKHIGSLLPKMKSVMPQTIDNEWVDMIENCSWKPLDVNAAVSILEEQSSHQTPDFGYESCPRNDSDGCKDWFTDGYSSEDAWDSSPRQKILGDSCDSRTMESKRYDKIYDDMWVECNGNAGYNGNHRGNKSISLPSSWPLSDDGERAKLLEKICSMFKLLIRRKYLSRSHLGKVIQFAVDELQGTASGSGLLSYGVDKTPVCICFLGASELKKIHKFLQELSRSCGGGRYSEKSNSVDDATSTLLAVDNTDKVSLDEIESCLLLDECVFLPCKFGPTIHHCSVTNDATAAVCASVELENGDFDADALFSWMFKGPASEEQLAQWMRTKEEKIQQGLEIIQMIEKEFSQLQSLCERKCEHVSYEEALQAVEDICLDEGKRREHDIEFVPQSYESILRKRREELIEGGNDVSNRFELDAISNVLKEADSFNINQFGFEETYNSTNHLYYLESGEEDDWRTKDYLHQADSCIEVAIQRQKDQLSNELSKIDAQILRNITGMQHLEVKLEPVSAYDYQSILVPLMKSYMRARLEDLAEKDATQKSDAAREAFLAELALDLKKGIGGGTDTSRHLNEKSKEKKKNKDSRKNKESKATGGNELHMLHQETLENTSLVVACDEDHSDSGTVVTGNSLDLSQQEEELRRIELEAEERKLEATLEYQRRIENEAKQKHLAVKHRKTPAILEKEAVGKPNDYFGHISYDMKVFEQLRCRQEPSSQSNGLMNTLECVPGEPGDDASQCKMDYSRTSYHGGEVKQSLNGVILENGDMQSDRRSGKRDKRQRSSFKFVDGKSQTMPSDKEVSEVGHVKWKDCPKGDVGSACLENGTKALRQLHSEEDDEERFQADLKRAVSQSLDTFHAYKKFPDTKMPRKSFSVVDDVGISALVNGVDVYGTGLKNEVGEYNCFLNVIIQSLWHIRRFREEFLRRSKLGHVHVGDPCVTCALFDIFSALSIASTDLRKEAVAPTSLRIALSNLYPESNFFQEAQMNDASEVLGVIFDCLHRSFTSGFGVSDTESVESNGVGSWDCVNNACLAHSLFGMNIFESLNCYNCGMESKKLKYTAFFHNINASALRTMKVTCPESSFDELLNFVEMNDLFTCDPEDGGCGKCNYKFHILSTPPHVFTTVLGWQNTCESVDDIRATLTALATEVDIGVLYRGLDPKNRHRLISVVCYYGQHYHCFAYSHVHGQWVMYDDATVKVIGGWDDVTTICERGHLQPQVLFYEAVN